MWYQKDWFTGIDYYNLKENQIHVNEMRITKPIEQRFHELTEIYYAQSGEADLWVNGEKFEIQEGSFFCLYMHLFYQIENIRKPLHCVKVSFHIGLFVFLCFETSGGTQYECCNKIIPCHGEQEFTNLNEAKAIKAVATKPVIVVGKILDACLAEDVLDAHEVDGLVLGRP